MSQPSAPEPRDSLTERVFHNPQIHPPGGTGPRGGDSKEAKHTQGEPKPPALQGPLGSAASELGDLGLSHPTTLGLSSFICKMGVMVTLTSLGYCENAMSLGTWH